MNGLSGRPLDPARRGPGSHWVTTIYIWCCPNGEIIWWSTQTYIP